MQIQWYPGHMTKAKRAMQADMRLIDLVIEITDARIPLASRNPDIDELAKGKGRLILLNKADLADDSLNERWASYFSEKGIHTLPINARTGMGLKKIQPLVQEACREKIERDRRRGILNRPVRAMVVGIPNVGKSTFINSFAGKACAKTGNKPGVTKGNQWIRLNRTLELLDTPGILWPKFEEERVGLLLAFIGSVNDAILNSEELAAELIAFLQKRYPGCIEKRYGLEKEGEAEERTGQGTVDASSSLGAAYAVLQDIARARSCLLKGNVLDTKKAAGFLLDDFRSGKLGKITLETPPEEKK